MKLWAKNSNSLKEVERFTIGKDADMDLYLAPFDVLGSMAHIRMLESVGLLTTDEWKKLQSGLRDILSRIDAGEFLVESGIEDIHSQVELELTRMLGESGKKIHSGRSRNDQVLTAIKLYLRSAIEAMTIRMHSLVDLLIKLSDQHANVLLPGYTHFQVAMPSSFGLWFGAYAESLTDDLIPLLGAYRVVNKNPLGSAAGYGSSFPLNRTLTTNLLGFDSLNYNVVYAQMTRGKSERVVASAMSNIALTLSRLSMDACMFMGQDMGFISFPDELTTGSSIMPHKKNPDVFELIRGRCNQIAALPNTLILNGANLPSGYHRDTQLVKEFLFPAIDALMDCLSMMELMLGSIRVKPNLLEQEKYQYIFSVEEVNKRVLKGVPFRDAYKEVGLEIEAGTFKPDRTIQHTHEGSIGQLNNPEIRKAMETTLAEFQFGKVATALKTLVEM